MPNYDIRLTVNNFIRFGCSQTSFESATFLFHVFRLRLYFLTLQQYRHFVRALSATPFCLYRHFLPLPRLSFFFAAFLFSLFPPFLRHYLIALPLFFCSLFVSLCFCLSVPFPPLKKEPRTGRLARIVLSPRNNVSSFATDEEYLQTKMQGRVILPRQWAFPARISTGNPVFYKQL